VSRRFIIFSLMLFLVSCGSQRSEIVVNSLNAEVNDWGFASLWVEAYNKGDEAGEITMWRVDIKSSTGRNIVWYEESVLRENHNGPDWSPLIGAKQVSKFCVHRGRGATDYRGALADVAVWVSDDEGEYIIGDTAEFP